MPKVPSSSPATGDPTPDYYIHTINSAFVDNAGRTLLLRGVNLSGSSKAPLDQPSWRLDGFWEDAQAGGSSFVGRPLNVDDGSADVHLARLRAWGFNMLRFPVTWEALEHEGPGIYDYDFMDYTVRVLKKCKEHGFKVFIDPHQDIWSRFSSGSGAPYWTLPACGINPRNLTYTQSAILHSEYPTAANPKPSSLPAMVWSTNYGRLLAQTIFTLFFAGRDFAPRCIIDGVNIQDYLQMHFINAFGELADRIRAAGDLFDECVIGWDSMNEPSEGLCGWTDLNEIPDHQTSTLKKGSCPTPAQSFRLGMGQAQTVEKWDFGSFGPKRDGNVTIDPMGHKLWTDEEEGGRWGWSRSSAWELGMCIWAQHGVWDPASGQILRPSYFASPPHSPQRPVAFVSDYWRPHFRAYAARIRMSHPEAILFIQPPVFVQPPPLDEEDMKGRGCYSAHYYDGLTLITRHWNWFNADALGLLRGKYKSPITALKVGETAIRKSLQEQLALLKSDTMLISPPSKTPYPTLIGEIGIPYDMDGKRSYGWTDGGKYKGDYRNQQKALDASLNAADGGNALNWTVWTYCPDHSHEWGDGWNMEDLSLWSEDDLRERREGMAAGRRGRYLMEPKVHHHRQGRHHTHNHALAPAHSHEKHRHSLLGRRRAKTVGTIGGATLVGSGASTPVINITPSTDLLTTKSMLLKNQSTFSANTATLMVREVTQQSASASALSLATTTRGFLSPSSKTAVSTPVSEYPPGPYSLSAEPTSYGNSRSHSQNASASTSYLPSRSSTPSSFLSSASDSDAITDLSRWGSAFEFLTDGARAVRSFCRPWPTATVGTPTNIEFSIAKAEFKMTVYVTSQDRPRGGVGARLMANQHARSKRETEGSESEIPHGGRLATEIFIPLVHFGNEAMVNPPKSERHHHKASRLGGNREKSRSKEREISEKDNDQVDADGMGVQVEATPVLPRAEESRVGLLDDGGFEGVGEHEKRRLRNLQPEPISFAASTTSFAESTTSSESSTTTDSASSASLSRTPSVKSSTSSRIADVPSALSKGDLNGLIPSSALTLSVQITTPAPCLSPMTCTTALPCIPCGTKQTSLVPQSTSWVSINGQTLNWYYPIPAPGERPKEYTLVVRRRGGPINGWAGGAPVKTKTSKGKRAKEVFDDAPTLCERICGVEGVCGVM
ncbi:glycoside hydrolase [Sistotremastrum suecicum HHB10207 ss-3]|uniref:Glycoside hydrolase n=1 Tax=Sistotremastrum suecicum HHB10207 ss-3 TaxID=1314776 RepID=A0A166C987_9AGAM|nr:glycoside hydrolase [Sistotremastrum suecicum HHB10207 ss-3]